MPGGREPVNRGTIQKTGNKLPELGTAAGRQSRRRALPTPGTMGKPAGKPTPPPKPPAFRSSLNSGAATGTQQAAAGARTGGASGTNGAWDQYYLNQYMKFSRGYRRMMETPTAKFVHRMAAEPQNFKHPDTLRNEYPEPPAQKSKKEENKEEQELVGSPKDQKDLVTTMNTTLQNSKEKGATIRSLVTGLGSDFSQLVGELMSSQINKERLVALTQHMVMLCDAGEETRAKFAKYPMVNKVFNVLDQVRGFAGRVSSVIQADIRLTRSRKFRAYAKRDLSNMRDDRERGKINSGYWGKQLDQLSETYEDTPDDGSGYTEFRTQQYRPRKEGRVVNRSGRRERLDEQTTRLRQSRIPASMGLNRDEEFQQKMQRDRELELYEQYDISRELAGANQKRRRDGWLQLLLQDGMALGRTLARLDPIAGNMLSATLELMAKGGIKAKEKITHAKNRWRNWKGTNKSDEEKAKRRHNLAHMMYRQLYNATFCDILGQPMPEVRLGVSPREVIEAQMRMDAYQNLYANMDATGREAQITASKDDRETIDEIRKGFYRNNS